MAQTEYTPSKKVLEDQAAAEAVKNTRPEYRSGREQQLEQLTQQILNGQDFRYSLNGDALYRQLAQQAAENGRRAMADAAGQAAAMTGGYGNSYAASVGQQAYQQHTEALSNRIPELYALALEQYRLRAQGLQQKYDLLSAAEDRDYTRYRDSLSVWQQEADRLWNLYTDSRDFDYGAYRDGVADRKWQTEFEESLRRYEQEWAAEHPAVTAPTYTAPAKKKEETKTASSAPRVVLL